LSIGNKNISPYFSHFRISVSNPIRETGMFYDQGCFGQVELGPIPREVSERLARIPGEWLEFDPPSGAVLVRHVQPTTAPHLPAIASELVRILSEIPGELHDQIPGGDFFVHTEDEHGQLVRLRVEPGGAIHIHWAHPDFRTSLKRPYMGGSELAIEPAIQRLTGAVTLKAADPEEAARALQELADTFEGLYPEGDCLARTGGEPGTVELTMVDVNLDAALLVDLLQQVALPRSLSGRFEVSSFGTALPEQRLRFLFERGKLWVQHPLLWSDPDTSEDR
jgi:hypothetical protein